MNTADDRWLELARLFEEALELPQGERAGFVSRLAGADGAVQDELVSLLDAHHALEAADSREGQEDSAFLKGLDTARVAALLGGAGASGPGPGDPIGPYRIRGTLGQGGMGVVYLAEDPRLGRDVALKLPPPWVGTEPGARRRLIDEARAASALDHPNIATIYEADVDESGRPYIAMAYYDGESLAERISRGPMPLAECLDVAAQVARGLAAAHAAGIVHRDIKAANVMLTNDGVVKILDFGIAKVAGSGSTGPGVTMGTVGYMSPEQLSGGEVDERSDLWAWGILVYEMLTGMRPFRAEAPEAVIHQILHDGPAPVGSLRPDVGGPVAELVDSCLAKAPDRRPASAREVLRGLGPPAGDVDGSGARARAAGRGPGRGTTTVALAVLALLALVWGSWRASARGPGAESDGPPSIAVLPFENLGRAAEAEPYVRGLHDDLLTHLSTVSGFRVISRRAVERYRGSDLTTARIATDLGVRWVVEGGVVRQGDRIQVNVRLIEPGNELQAWAGRYERDLTAEALFGLQSEITVEIARALETRLTPAEEARVGRMPTGDLDAYRRYVEGRTLLDRRSESGLQQGATRFREALAVDSSYAEAWAGLADALSLLASYGHVPRDSVLPEAQAAAERALALDDGLAEAHASLGLMYQTFRYDGPASLRELETAVRLNPSYARAHHWLGNLLISLGRLDEARDPLIRAAELDPTSPPIRGSLARWYQFADSLGPALEHARRAEQLSPSFTSATMLTGEILRGMGRLEEGRDALERAIALPGLSVTGTPGIWVELALITHELGDTARSTELANQLAEMPPFVRAGLFAGLSQADTALALLSASPVLPEMAGMLRYLPVFESIRGDARYRELLSAYDRAWGVESGGGPG